MVAEKRVGGTGSKNERFWNNFADPLTPLMSSDTSGPKLTFVVDAASGGFEPSVPKAALGLNVGLFICPTQYTSKGGIFRQSLLATVKRDNSVSGVRLGLISPERQISVDGRDRYPRLLPTNNPMTVAPLAYLCGAYLRVTVRAVLLRS